MQENNIKGFLSSDLEQISENVHNRWMEGRKAAGWKYGPMRNDEKKEHPFLLIYSELPEKEKEYDRQTALETIRSLMELGYEISKK